MGACFLGQFTTLSRSDWLCCAAGIGASFIVLPKGARGPSFTRAMIALPFLGLAIYAGMYAGSRITGRDVVGKMHARLLSMLPGDRPGTPKKAWNTRLPGTFAELRMFASSPIIGGGFGVQDTPEMEPYVAIGLRHNTWSSTLCETGLIGFSAFAVMVGGMMIAGWRMTRDRLDATTVVVGAFGFITGATFIMLGLATMSFNQVRGGLPLFIVAGVVLRTRAMQLTQKRILAEERAYVAQYGYAEDALEAEQQPYLDEPVFGNWYQHN
jgi:O-antigen ligase